MTYAEKVEEYKRALAKHGVTPKPAYYNKSTKKIHPLEPIVSVYLVTKEYRDAFGSGSRSDIWRLCPDGRKTGGLAKASESELYLTDWWLNNEAPIQNFYFISDECEPVGLEELI